jgi:MFS family permease
MGLSEQVYGLLLTSTAAGSLLGSFLAERAERAMGRARALLVSFTVSAVTIAVPTVTTNATLVGAGLFVGSLGVMVTNIVMVSLRQRITPDRLLGRLNSAHRLVGWGTKPLGAVLGGALAQLLGLRAVFVVVALLPLIAVAGLLKVTDRAMDEAERP